MRIPMMLLLTALAGAGGSGCVDSSAAEPTVVDLPAIELSLEPSILDDDPAPTDGKVLVMVQVFRGNQFVKLAGNVALSCNDMPVLWSDLGYSVRIPLPAAGSTLVFSHVRGGVTTRAMLRVPPRPVVNLAEGTTLTRSSSFAISYVPTTSAGVRPGASDAAIGVSGSEQSDNGTAYLDVSGLRPGAGTVGISRRYLSLPTGTGFASVIGNYNISSASVAVTWQ